jgi:hypothetical protein
MKIKGKAMTWMLVYYWAGLASCPCASGRDADRPPKVFVDVGACPFECCTYREWTVRKSVRLLDQPNGMHVVGALHKGEAVQGLTGEVISTPIAVKVNRALPGTPIKAGDTFYVLHYDGEGDWKVWFRGETTFVNQSVVNVPRPKSEWWVKVRKSAGVVGWALSDDHFLHQDACE